MSYCPYLVFGGGSLFDTETYKCSKAGRTFYTDGVGGRSADYNKVEYTCKTSCENCDIYNR